MRADRVWDDSTIFEPHHQYDLLIDPQDGESTTVNLVLRALYTDTVAFETLQEVYLGKN